MLNVKSLFQNNYLFNHTVSLFSLSIFNYLINKLYLLNGINEIINSFWNILLIIKTRSCHCVHLSREVRFGATARKASATSATHIYTLNTSARCPSYFPLQRSAATTLVQSPNAWTAKRSHVHSLTLRCNSGIFFGRTK